MNPCSLLLVTSLGLASVAITAQGAEPVTSESRDAAAAYVGTTNFTVGRIGRDCLALLGRPESPQEFVQAWQGRNAKYYIAHQKYMLKRLDQALVEGGVPARDAVAIAYGSAVRREGDASAARWLQQDGKEKGCSRAVQLVDSGAMDIGPKVPIISELDALVTWGQ